MRRPHGSTAHVAALLALLLLAVSILLALAACGSSDRVAGSVVQTSSASTAHWDYVVLGDSVFIAPGGMTTVPAAQARLIKRDLGVDAKVNYFYYPGTNSAFVRDSLRYDPGLRAALRSAELVLFDVPVGEMKRTIPWDKVAYRPLPGTPQRYRRGMAKMLAGYRKDARAIVEEIVSLRGPSKASIRAIDMWELGYPQYRKLGVGVVMREAWLRMNQAVDDACAAHGVPVVDGYTAFMGRDGKTDPVATGYVLPDQMHLTDRGVAILAKLLHKTGYAELAPTP